MYNNDNIAAPKVPFRGFRGARGFRGILCFFTICNIYGQEIPDTIATHQLNTVEVKAVYPSVNRATSPLQVLQGSKLQKMNALQVSDAVKFFSGVQVKDYGGVGGLKTVSIRSLGANHTTVAYDGITLTDYQTGQIDLGRFSLDNVEMLSLNIGESDDIFQTARMQSTAGVFNIVSRKPQFDENKVFGLRGGMKAGSFGFLNPAIIYEQRLNKKFSSQVSAEWMKTDGNYPFIHYYDVGKDSIAKRKNSDVERLNIETNITGNINDNKELLFKAYYYHSDRRLPGPVKSGLQVNHEQTNDDNFFVQGRFKQQFSKKMKFQTNAKFNYSYMDYRNIYQRDTTENKYEQREYYLNATVYYEPAAFLAFSWANDGSYGNFSNNFYDCPFPLRMMWQSALSGKYNRERLVLNGSLLNTYVCEEVKVGESPVNKYRLSPYFGFSWKLFEYQSFYFRGFYKDAFRLPTFGDLYYPRIGNRNLKPENAKQHDLGISWIRNINSQIPYFSVVGDVYYNLVKDKIVAFPKNSLLIWSTENIGKVVIKGFDLNFDMRIKALKNVLWELGMTYTYQDARVKTDSSLQSYNQQIAFTPKHSGSGRLGFVSPWFDVNYTALLSGKRYDRNYNSPEYELSPYTDQSISLSKTFTLKKVKLFVSGECLNLFDTQYQMVRNYPLQGRSYKIILSFTY